MAQLTLYVDEETARRTRQAAKRSGKSLSAWARECLREAAAEGNVWPEGYFDLFGSVGDPTWGRPDEPLEPEDVARDSL